MKAAFEKKKFQAKINYVNEMNGKIYIYFYVLITTLTKIIT